VQVLMLNFQVDYQAKEKPTELYLLLSLQTGVCVGLSIPML
jgi:hypothetical protein